MRARTIWALAIVAVIVVSVVVLFVFGGRSSYQGLTAGDKIAVVRLSGAIQESSGLGLTGTGAITPRLVRDQLRRIRQDSTVKAVVLRVDSPGGSVGASQEIAEMVRTFDKPIVVSMGDMAASGGYYISAYAQRIVANRGTLTGSIGVIWTFVDIDGLLDKLGVKLDTVTSGEHKDMFLTGRLTPERRAFVQKVSDTMYNQFIETVAQGRGLEVARVRKLATGELFSGEQALELGLVDELGGLDTAIEAAAKLANLQQYQVTEYQPSAWQLLFGSGSDVLSEIVSLARTALVDRDVLLLYQALSAMAGPRY